MPNSFFSRHEWLKWIHFSQLLRTFSLTKQWLKNTSHVEKGGKHPLCPTYKTITQYIHSQYCQVKPTAWWQETIEIRLAWGNTDTWVYKCVYLVVGTFRLMTIKYFMFLLLNLPKFYFLNIALARLRLSHIGIQCINVGLRDTLWS